MVEALVAERSIPQFKDAVLSHRQEIDFHLPPFLEATEPPEARGMSRDQVRLMVSHYKTGEHFHSHFRDIISFLRTGDVLVINTSGTRSAAIAVRRRDGTPLVLHLSTHLPSDLWSVELRVPDEKATKPFTEGEPGELLSLPGGGEVTLLLPYNGNPRRDEPVRLWLAKLDIPSYVDSYLQRYGSPIRYSYLKGQWPIDYYQTVFVTETGSAEMPSAGRPFTPKIITALIAKGVIIAPLLLHTGVASLERHEAPYEEYYRVSPVTADIVTTARAAGRRVIAVGTTSVRALETVTDEAGVTNSGEGWTNLVVTPERGIHAVDGLLTGFHEPRASHLAMLESLAGRSHLRDAYEEAIDHNYLWHEFGDLHLLLP